MTLHTIFCCHFRAKIWQARLLQVDPTLVIINFVPPMTCLQGKFASLRSFRSIFHHRKHPHYGMDSICTLPGGGICLLNGELHKIAIPRKKRASWWDETGKLPLQSRQIPCTSSSLATESSQIVDTQRQHFYSKSRWAFTWTSAPKLAAGWLEKTLETATCNVLERF